MHVGTVRGQEGGLLVPPPAATNDEHSAVKCKQHCVPGCRKTGNKVKKVHLMCTLHTAFPVVNDPNNVLDKKMHEATVYTVRYYNWECKNLFFHV